jgi:undecaprenyl-diphosphatase
MPVPLKSRLPTPLATGFVPYRALVRPFAVGLAAALLAFVFIQISGEVVEGDTHAFDALLLRVALDLKERWPWVGEVMRDLSGLGSTTVLTIVTVASVGFLALARTWRTAVLVALAVLSGSLVVSALKTSFGRPRPDPAFADAAATSLSFPSGHASLSAIVFLTLGILLAGTRPRAVERTYIVAMAIVMTLLVGMSRVALGVHWATDVLAGWAFGAAWAITWSLLDRDRWQASIPA